MEGVRRFLVLALALAATGCVAHAGVSIGHRPLSGRTTVGWQAGAGSYGEVVLGQQWDAVQGKVTWAGVRGWYPIYETWYDDWDVQRAAQADVGLTLGYGRGRHGGSGVFGVDARGLGGYSFHERGWGNLAGLVITVGVRAIDGEPETYVAAEAMIIGGPEGAD